MNIKIALGIFLPLILAIFLTFVSASEMGLTIESADVESVSFSSTADNDVVVSQNAVLVRTIHITNDFFLPRKVEIPRLLACLKKGDVISDYGLLTLNYRESGFSVPSQDVYFRYSFDSRSVVNMPSNSSKEILVYLEPSRYAHRGDSLETYDAMVLVELKGSSRGWVSCSNLDSNRIASVTEIPIAR